MVTPSPNHNSGVSLPHCGKMCVLVRISWHHRKGAEDAQSSCTNPKDGMGLNLRESAESSSAFNSLPQIHSINFTGLARVRETDTALVSILACFASGADQTP